MEGDLPVAHGGEHRNDALVLVAQEVADPAEVIRRIDRHNAGEHVQRADLFGAGEEALGVGEHFTAAELLELGAQLADLVRARLGAGKQLLGLGLEPFGERHEKAGVVLDEFERFLAGDGLDTAHTARNGELAHDAQRADLRGIVEMRAAAEFHGVALAHIDDADNIAVLFAEERHRAETAGLRDGYFLHRDGEALEHGFVHHALDGGDLLGLHGGEVGKVKAETVGLNERTGLVDMVAENGAQRLVQQVGGAVGAHDRLAATSIDAGVHLVADSEIAGDHHAVVQHLAGLVLLHIVHLKNGVLENEQAVVGALTAHFGVERRFIENDARANAGADALAQLVLGNDGEDGAVVVQALIAGELGGEIVQAEIEPRPGGLIGAAGGAGALALLLHQSLERGLIDRHALIRRHLFREIEREAVGIVEFEGVGAGEHGLALFLMGGKHTGEDSHAAVDRAGEVFLLGADDAGDILLPLGKLGVSAAVLVDDGIADLIKERLLLAEQTSVAGGAAEQTAQHVAAALVGGENAVADHKGRRADVVGDDAERHVLRVRLAVMRAGDLAHLVGDVHHGIDVEEGVHVLADDRETLQTHAGVDVLLGELGVVALAVVVELGEHDVPDLDIPVAVAPHGAAGLAAAVFLTAVIVDLGAGAARTAAVLPEVILFAEAENALRSDADLVVPDVPGLVIVEIDARIQPVGIDADPVGRGQKFPRPVDGFALEVIAEGEVAEHFKVGAVARRLADILDIGRADALLAGRHAAARRLFLSGEPRFHGAHAGVDEQKRRVVAGDQREAGQTQMTFCLKEGEIHLPQLIESEIFHTNLQKQIHPAPEKQGRGKTFHAVPP